MAREVELKFQLPDGRAARALAAAAGEELSSAVQVNHVFDTPGRDLRGRGLTLRLREEDGRWTVTLKGPSRRVGAARDREELEAAIDAAGAAAILDGEASPLDALEPAPGPGGLLATARSLAGDRVRSLGSFRNRRTRVRASVPGHGVAVLEIDRTELPGGRIDHEVELELAQAPGSADPRADRAEAWLRRLLEDIGVEPATSSGKTGRFLEALEGA